MKMLKLGTIVRDNATGLKVMLTMMQMRQDGTQYYNAQPCVLNPKDGSPVKHFWTEPNRIVGGIDVEIDLPVDVLGTEARDTATGFHGKVISITSFMSGCVHINIQPEGRNRETGAAFDDVGFDILRCEGKAIKKLTEAKKAEARQERPSPMPYQSFRPKI